MMQPSRQPLGLSIPVVIASALLGGVFLLQFEVPIVLAMALTGFLLACFGLYKLRADRIAVLVLANYAYWLLTGFFVGAVSLSDLASPHFFNSDGRIFLFYVPLLFFSVVTVSRQDLVTTVS